MCKSKIKLTDACDFDFSLAKLLIFLEITKFFEENIRGRKRIFCAKDMQKTGIV